MWAGLCTLRLRVSESIVRQSCVVMSKSRLVVFQEKKIRFGGIILSYCLFPDNMEEKDDQNSSGS